MADTDILNALCRAYALARAGTDAKPSSGHRHAMWLAWLAGKAAEVGSVRALWDGPDEQQGADHGRD